MTRIATVLALIVTFIATAANAQIHQTDPNKKTFVCVEIRDIYRLAIADIQGTLDPLARKFAAEGRCMLMPATYLFTLDRYVDSTGEPSRVVEMTVRGERMWGIFGSLPPQGVWLISHH